MHTYSYGLKKLPTLTGCPLNLFPQHHTLKRRKRQLRIMRTAFGMACIVMGFAIIGLAFDVQAAVTEARDGFLRANPSDGVSRSYDIGLCVRRFNAKRR